MPIVPFFFHHIFVFFFVALDILPLMCLMYDSMPVSDQI